jgi:Holliday junction resolvase RusA-like endonuclease
MRCIVDYREHEHPPLLRLYIHHAPHRRQDIATSARYRDELVAAGRAAALELPIRHPIDLRVTFIDPCSRDLDNLITALFRAMDGRSHDRPTLLFDDGLIESISMAKFYPAEATKADRSMRGLRKLRLVADKRRVAQWRGHSAPTGEVPCSSHGATAK